MVFSLKHSKETLEVYPFEFELLVKYLLHENEVTVTYEVVNPSLSEEMYYSVGGHPAFNVSQQTTEEGEAEFNQVSFQLEPIKEYPSISLSDEGLLEINQIEEKEAAVAELEHENFAGDALIYEIEAQTEMVLRIKQI